mgnify:CR=1 FL=1
MNTLRNMLKSRILLSQNWHFVELWLLEIRHFQFLICLGKRKRVSFSICTGIWNKNPHFCKVVEKLGTIQWNGMLVHDLLPNRIIFFYLWSLANKKLRFLLIIRKLKLYFSITKPCGGGFEATVFNQEWLIY